MSVNAGVTRPADQAQRATTVERAADVLMLFLNRDAHTLGVTEIAASLGLSKPAVHRILASLRSRGLVGFDTETHRYALGASAMALGLTYLTRLDVRRHAMGEMRDLAARTGETATLSLRSGHTRLYVDQVTPRRDVATFVPVGVPFPLHVGAPSKAFLAFLTEAQVASYVSRRITGDAEDGLLREFAAIRERGWARSCGERQPGATAVAAPVWDRTGCPAAVVSLCGPTERFTGSDPDTARLLLATPERLSGCSGIATVPR